MKVVSEYFHVSLNRWFVRLEDGTQTYRYRHLMEEHLGRKLASDEHVHHVNGDPTENLRVLSASEHGRLHGADAAARELARRGGRWTQAHDCCVECGTTERKHFGKGLCMRCYCRRRDREVHGRKPRQPATVVTKNCLHCGEEFSRTLKQGDHKYCSLSCSSRATIQDRWAKRKAAA